MSPYTFVFAIKVYLELMGQVVRDKDFGFYWRCEKEQLTHLCFADDLMIFYWAEVGIVSLIENYVDQFQLFFGLPPNLTRIVCSCMVLILMLEHGFLMLSIIREVVGQVP